MLHFSVPRARRASAWLVMTVLIALVGFLVILPVATAQSDSNQSTPSKQVEPTTANPSAGQRVAKDPATGQLREPTPEEVKELEAGQAKMAPQVKKPLQLLKAAPAAASGAVGVLLDESYETYAVATRSADGKVKFDCVQGKKDAEARVQSDNKTQPATKEAGNEK
ncbi:MAG: hypothetical protein LAN37_00390 [Acidobacteriia bacterium]|nr:hypothetical protein [Terriglobia bacterium]